MSLRIDILSSFVTISSGNGSNLARLSSSALSRSRCRFDGFPGLKIRFKKQDLGQRIFHISRILFCSMYKKNNFRNHGLTSGENTPHKHHTMSRLKSDNRAFSTSRFSHRHETPTNKQLTILTHGFSSSV